MNQEIIRNLFTVIFTVFGSLIGSFSNVVILRMASATSVVFPPSACPTCNHRLSAFDLIPVFSWLLLGGKCRYCKAPISCQYPLVEASAAAMVGFSFFTFGFSLNYIVYAGGSVIWFVSSVLFIRNEVKKAQPFMWAAIYLLVLGFLLSSNYIATAQTILISISIAIVVAILGCKADEARSYPWGALTFIGCLRLFSTMPYLMLIPLIIAMVKYFKPTCTVPDKLFFATQYVFIFLSIAIH